MSGPVDKSTLGHGTRSVLAGRRDEWTGTPGHPGAVVNPPVWRASTHIYPDMVGAAVLPSGRWPRH